MREKDTALRFWSKVRFTDTCWLWTGFAHGRGGGYGNFAMGNKREVQAHRWAYEFCVGPIPEGLQLDHLCRVRLCVLPDHLEPVTGRVNTLRGVGACAVNARKTHCTNGHEFSIENTYRRKEGGRRCRTCQKRAVTRWRHANLIGMWVLA